MLIWLQKLKYKFFYYPKTIEQGQLLSVGNYRIVKYNSKKYEIHKYDNGWAPLSFYLKNAKHYQYYKEFTSYKEAKEALLLFDGAA